MKRGLYYFLKIAALVSRVFNDRRLYMKLLKRAHEVNGVQFKGEPRFIHPNVVLDATGSLVLGDNIVISTGVLLLTHDYSFTAGLIALDEKPQTDIAFVKSIIVGDNCFIGANSTILPGSKIGSNVIVGAGSVVKGIVPEFSVVSGNPAKFITDIRDWAQKKKESIDPKYLLIDKN